MSELLDRKAQNLFEQRVRLVTAAGVAMPPECVALQNRLKAFQRAGGNPMRDRLVAALVDDDRKADLPELWALTLAEASPQRADVFDTVSGAVNSKLRQLYATHSAELYAQLSAMFDSTADRFTAAVGIYDPEASAEAAVGATDTQRAAWIDAAALSRKLVSLLPALQAAAVLAGVDAGQTVSPDGSPAYGGDNTVNARDLLLPLSVDTTGLHRRRVWDAWDAEERAAEAQAKAAQGFSVTVPPPSRTGRWGALVKLGANIRACPLDDFRPYLRPRQMEHRVENLPGRGTRKYWVDPEDDDYKPQRPALSHEPLKAWAAARRVPG